MNNNLFLIVFLIFIGQTLGSIIGLIKKPRKSILHGSLAFAASVMLSISFFQLMPESIKMSSIYFATAFFIFGTVIFWIIDKILPHINPELMKKEKPSIKKSIAMLVIGMALHNLPEGLAIGAGFARSSMLGIIIALGIAAQDLPENIAVIVPVYGLTKNRLKSFIITAGTVLFEVFGFILGYCLLKNTTLGLIAASLALAAGFMSYISIEELIPSAQIKKYPRICILSFIFGIVCVLLIGFLIR